MSFPKKLVQSLFHSVGFEIRRNRDVSDVSNFPVELFENEKELLRYVKINGLTMVSDQRLFATIMACKHVIDQNIEGDFVECGVWAGGNSILAAGVFKLNGANRRTFLYDTFAGMTEPSLHDRTPDGRVAELSFQESQRDGFNKWCFASLEDVKNNFKRANLIDENVRFIQGDVRKTLMQEELLPKKISVLRLDTDWYDSTLLELEILYPRLSAGGILVIDDYGHWYGAKKAVDEYFEKNGNRPFLQYTDYTGRMGVKYV